ncbi:hypothetical protein EJ02DRAFT_423610 [Clathrospora elynae]|uniref:Cell wall anchored protein n=1 Tax=Clathrospora elynae TaxID=706981 RepID=A0A6A5SJF0_9PLEO|nr:hypothetical protein EJ02DRAFT_423610 [Clathrospora elynae]
MAYIHQCLLVVLSFAVISSSQQDPIGGFCRRWGHRTAQIDSRLYIDGGMIGSDPFTSNYTNPWLLFSDLNSSTGDAAMPRQFANLSKPGNVPSLSGGYIWADNTNKCFYQFGGEYPDGVSPMDFSMWTYDVLLNQWNDTVTSGDETLQRVSFGAGTQLESRGLGFYFGGWLSSQTTLGWKGPPMATNGLIRFDMSTGELRNITGPDNIGRAEGQMVFLPASDGGMLIYFGGIEDSYRNGSFNGANMSDIQIYDMASSKWYKQAASGDIPLPRRQFCADVTWPDDQSSFNIYLYGGYGFSRPAFDDAYILSIPSFTWIKVYPTDGNDSVPSTFGHGGCSANVVNHAQMLVMGGWFPSYDKCDSPESQGQHNMVLGYNGKAGKLWDKYDPELSHYVVPSPIIAAIGGGPTGGATVTKPSTWGHPDLATYYTLKPTFSSRAATRSVPPATSSPSSGSPKKTSVAAIAGGTAGGLAVLIVILGLILFCLHRRKKALKKEGGQNEPPPPPPPPPAELAVTSISHEMSSSIASKYVSIHDQSEPVAMSNYPNYYQQHSRSASHEYNSPYSAQEPPLYGSAPNFAYNSSSEGHLQREDQQRAHFPQSQGQYTYPTPTSPRQSPDDAIQQQVPIYYPPPADAATRPQHSQPSFSEQRGSLTGTQFIGDGQPPNISMTTTPAHFYAQPVSCGSPGTDDGGGYSPEDRRPAQGRFVEG